MKFLRDITEFIFLEDLPEKADLIIVPGNTWPQPARRAAALYHEGMAPYIVVSGRYSKGQQTFAGAACEGDRYKGAYMTEADFLTDVLIREGVPETAVLQERKAEFTLENARYIRRLLEEKKMTVKKALICCQAFHARRCRMYFEYVFQDTDVEFLMCPAVTQGISRCSWMESQKGLDTVLGELRRCGEQFAWMCGHQDRNGVPVPERNVHQNL
ncbi:YdcF family protein [Coprococcus catus]|uniref:YdcF family protein n=1 Tax=Coprococcus catus TaxID=116085 RepID=UPI001C8BE2A1|nr:YdcF family protein [Coprococcus catus]MBX9230298.1 YdcF family protein [Coprococcus catus]MCT6798647.1 YdcF family protein [Coprococcus catus]